MIEAKRPSRYIPPLVVIAVVITSLLFHGGHKNIYTTLAILPPLLILLSWQAIRFHDIDIAIPLRGPLFPLLLFSLWSLLSISWSQAPVISANTATWFISGLVAASIAFFWERGNHNGLMKLGIVLTLGLSVYTAYQAFILGQERPTGLLLNWNNHAAFLNLFLLPLCALYLSNSQTRHYRLLGPGIAIITFAMALTLSRGALLGLLTGLALLLLVAHKTHSPLKTSIQLLLWISAGYLIGDLANNGEFFHRFFSSIQGENVTSGRLDIWDSTVRVYQDFPLLGTGIGTFFTIYPQYRHPFEGSAGQYAHNDYLQFLMELGPLGLFLALWITISVIYTGLKLITASGDSKNKIEIAGLTAAIVAILLHTVFTFNLYHMPILIMLGIYVGHISQLAVQKQLLTSVTLNTANTFSAAGYRLIIIGLLFIPLSFFLFNTLSHLYAAKVTSASSGKVALQYLDKAERFYPMNYRIYFFKAKQIEKILLERSDVPKKTRIELIEYGLKELDKGLELYPLSYEIYQFQALLMQQEADHYSAEIDHTYQKILTLNPFYLSARLKYTDFLKANDLNKKAYDVIRDGYERAYFGHHQTVLDFLEQLKEFHIQFSNQQAAGKIKKEKIRLMRKRAEEGAEAFLFRIGKPN